MSKSREMERGSRVSQPFFYRTTKWVIGIIIVIVIVGLIGAGIKIGKVLSGGIGEKKIQISQTVLQERMEAMGELATMRYYYTDMGKYDSSRKIGDLKIPFTTTSFIITYDGIIKVGMNLEEAKIQVGEKNIVVKIPPSKILSHEIIEDSTVVYDEKYSIFNGLNVSDVTEFQAEQKNIMEKKVLDSGICQEANEKAIELIQSICYALVENQPDKEEYKIVVEVEEQNKGEKEIGLHE